MSNNLNIDQMVSNQDQKEVTSNDGNGQLDAAMTASVSIAIDNTNAVTLTASQWTRQLMFTFTDSGTTAACTATVPATARGIFIVVNSCGQTLDVEISGQSGGIPQIPDGDTAILACDGTDVFSIGAIGGGGGGNTDILDWKQSVRAATTADGTLATAYEDGDTIDGITLATGDRILLKDQTAGSENGIYTVNASGSPTRATDFDEDTEVTSGAACYVEEGDENEKTIQFLTTSGAITIGTTALIFEGVTAGPETVEVGGFVGGVPSVSTTILRYLAADAASYPADLANSVGHAGTGPSAQTDFDIQKNGVSVGTMRFASAATTATFLTNPAFSLISGDRLDIITPANLNSLADLSYTLTGTRG